MRFGVRVKAAEVVEAETTQATCRFVLNEGNTIHPENYRFCGAVGMKPLRLPSGFIVGWLCFEHAYVADA